MKYILILACLWCSTAMAQNNLPNGMTIDNEINTYIEDSIPFIYKNNIIATRSESGTWVIRDTTSLIEILYKKQEESNKLLRKATLSGYKWQELYYALIETAAHLNTPLYYTYLKKYMLLKKKYADK